LRLNSRAQAIPVFLVECIDAFVLEVFDALIMPARSSSPWTTAWVGGGMTGVTPAHENASVRSML
jgi:hypothetical protein